MTSEAKHHRQGHFCLHHWLKCHEGTEAVPWRGPQGENNGCVSHHTSGSSSPSQAFTCLQPWVTLTPSSGDPEPEPASAAAPRLLTVRSQGDNKHLLS